MSKLGKKLIRTVSESQFDALVFIGRFQPLHLGHVKVIQTALRLCDKLVLLVGSANRSRSIQNPFTFKERRQMIYESIPLNENRLAIIPMNDYTYNDEAWLANVQRLVKENLQPLSQTAKIGLVGFSKDNSSYYLKLFPQWDSVNVDQISIFNSTDIRHEYFRPMPRLPPHKEVISQPVSDFLKKFMFTDDFINLVHEAHEITTYKKAWEHSPFPPTFQTVDNVVVQSGHILLVERGDYPGKGLLAFPGGFVNQDETLIEAACRELKEETKISDWKGEIPPGVLKSFITKTETFDDPRRSARGRTITQAYLYELPKKEKLYKVIGSDDAAHAQWYPIGTIKPELFFEDHYFIMCKMLGLTME